MRGDFLLLIMWMHRTVKFAREKGGRRKAEGERRKAKGGRRKAEGGRRKAAASTDGELDEFVLCLFKCCTTFRYSFLKNTEVQLI